MTWLSFQPPMHSGNGCSILFPGSGWSIPNHRFQAPRMWSGTSAGTPIPQPSAITELSPLKMTLSRSGSKTPGRNPDGKPSRFPWWSSLTASWCPAQAFPQNTVLRIPGKRQVQKADCIHTQGVRKPNKGKPGNETIHWTNFPMSGLRKRNHDDYPGAGWPRERN